MEQGTLEILIVVVFVVLVLVATKLLKRIAAESPGNQWVESFKALAGELNASVKGTTMTGTFEGLTFECSRTPFWIEMQFPLPVELSIKKANLVDRLWIILGLVKPIFPGDSDFDKNFAVRTDNREIAQKILQNNDCLELIKKLFTLFPAWKMLIANKNIRVTYKTPGGLNIKHIETFAREQPAMIKGSLQQLSQLIRHTRAAEELALTSEPKTAGQVYIRIINLMLVAIVVIGGLLITVGFSKYEPLEIFLKLAFKLILPYVFILTAIALLTRYLKIKKSNYTRLALLETLFSYFILLMLSGMGYFVFTNGYLDKSPEIKEIVPVQQRWKSGSDYYISFQLSTIEKKEEIEVAESFYETVKRGDPLIIIYKQGYHHVPWLVSYEKGEKKRRFP